MKKLIALLLLLALLVQIFPLSVFAEGENGPAQAEVVETETEEPKLTVLGEMTDRRGESEKHFRMNDGSFVAVDYGAPVHYTEDNGATWEDIDNTLALTRGDAELYVAENGDSVRSFAPDLGSGQLFTVANGVYSLRMGLSSDADNAASGTRNFSSTAEISYPDEKTRGEEELSFAEQITPEKLRADVLYRNVYDGVDLSYTLYSYDVKETIVINRASDSYAFSFDMDPEGMMPVLLSDGSIELRNADSEVIYQIPGPYMYDAAGAESTAVTYALEETASGSWTLTVTADLDWINDEARVFPVSIDPTIYFAGSTGNDQIFSGYINSKRPNTHPSDSASYIRCGYLPGSTDNDGYFIGLIYVNKLPGIPENCVITTSMLKLFQAFYSSDDTQEDLTSPSGWSYKYCNFPYLYSSQINDPTFDPDSPLSFLDSLTWNNLSSKVYYGNGSSLSARTALDYTKCRFDKLGDHFLEITETTRKWYSEDDGLSRLLVLDDGQATSDSTRATFSGYGHNSFGHQPQLVVFYRNTVGVEGYYDYHTQSIGRAGTASVNNFTLGLSLSVPVFSAPSQALPFGLALTYNSPLSNASFTESSSLHTKDYSTSGTGFGWKTSVQQSVAVVQLTGQTGSNKKWLVYTDGDGTEHYFSLKTDSTTEYEDEDGLGLTITVNSASNPTTFTMKDKETNTWVFRHGYLMSYTDHNGNALYYAYNGYNYNSGSSNWKPDSANTVYRVTSVWRQNSGVSSAAKLVTLNYTNNRLSSIVDMANRTTTFNYDTDENLTTISYPDGQTATYTYSNAPVPDPQTGANKIFHRLVKARDDEAQYEIRYTYWSTIAPRVKEIKEYTGEVGSEAAGTIMRGYKSSATTTVFRYCGKDNDLQTEDDLIVHYYFDNWGRPVNVVAFDTDGNNNPQNILGVSAGTFTQNSETNKDNNRMTHAAAGGLQGVNLLNNSGLEAETSLSGWTATGDGIAVSVTTSNTAYTTEITPRTGEKMMKLYLGGSTGQESCYQTVYLTAEKTYVFSAYVNTAAVSLLGTGGPYLSFRAEDEPDEWIDVASSRTLNYRTSTAVDCGWERLEAVFIPEDSGIYQVAVNLSDMGKVVLADDLQLETVPNTGGIEGEASASTVNLLQLGGFELPGANEPDTSQVQNWWDFSYKVINNQRVYRITPENDDDRGTVIRLSNAPDRQVWATQEVPLNAPANRTYLLSGWGKIPVGYTSSGNDLKYNNATYERFFGFIVEVHYAGYSEVEYQYLAFNDNLGNWQYTTGVIAPKHPNRTVEKLVVKIRGDLLPNDAYVDDVSLIQEPVQTYTYDENGNLIAATNSEGKTSTELDNKDRLKKYTAMNGVVYNLTYEGNSRQPKTIVSDGITTTYTYDDAGNVTNTNVQAPNNGPYLESGAAYDSTKNFQTAATDTNGNTSYSSYNASKGLLTSSTDPNGVATTYTYNANNDRVASTYQNGNEKTYLYYQYNGKGQLKQLNRKDYLGTVQTRQGYHFEYDAWGNTTSIKVGSVSSDTSGSLSSHITLASYLYNDSGTLARMNYPGGQYVTYEYDKLDRLIEEVYYDSNNDVQADYRYVYNANGQLAKQYAVETNGDDEIVTESYVFAYDSLGRLIRSREENGSNAVQRTEHLYDSANRLTAQNWSIGSSGFSEQYGYSSVDGTMTTFDITSTLPNGNSDTFHLNYDYDKLNRMEKASFRYSNETTPIYTRNYAYLNYTGSSTRTTSRLGTYTVKYHDTDLLTGSQYEYDANGNITKIEEAYWTGSAIAYRPVAEYVYDELNQLKIETRKVYTGTSTTPTTTTVVTYVIDTAGNISSVETKVNDVVTDTVTYTYGNAYWSDRLTAITVNGTSKTVSYVTYLNPSSWYNGTHEFTNLTWTQGRRLSGITEGSDTYSYEYDMSGIRTVKIADGLKHEYVAQSGRVVRESVYSPDSVTGEYTVFEYVLDFTYDESGHPLTMRKYNNANMQDDYITMQYICNAQGDVVKLIYNGTVYAEYTYDAWGNVLTATENGSYDYAALNPLRYRGYYYDTETGFYYLQSRYYDPIVKRFLNADSYAATPHSFLGYNMFSYCGNNPIMCIDEGGADYIWQRLFEDYHFGFIHLAVQMHIISRNPGIGMERYVYNNEDKQCGRADIFNLETGEVWELKTVRTGAAAADLQVTQYCGNHLKNSKKPITKGSAGMFPGRFAGTFELSCMGDNYTVIYYTPEPGVILYAVKRSSIKATDPYAVYVPTPQTTPEKQSTIGGIPAYGTNSGTGYAAAGLAMFGAVGYLFIGGGYGNNRSYCFQ